MFLKIFARNDDGSVFNEYLATLTGCIIYFSAGAHTAWPSPFLPQLQSSIYPFKISNEVASLIAIAGPIGDILGEILCTILADRIGRKNCLAFSGFPMLLSCIFLYYSNISTIFLYCARFLGGISMGIVISLAPMYIAEISRPKIRGKLGVMCPLAFILGVITINFLGKFFTVYTAGGIVGAFVIVFLIFFRLMPETPYYLLMKAKNEKTENSLVFLRRSKDVKFELANLEKDVKRQMSETGKWLDLIRIQSNRKALLLMIFARIFQQTTGITAFTMYAQHLLRNSRQFLDPEVSVLIIFLLQACVVIISGNLSDKFGRVPLIVFSTSFCFITLIFQGLYFSLNDFYELPHFLPVLLLGIYSVVFQVGIGSLIGVMQSEVFSASIKPKATCIVNISYSITVVITTKFYQVSADYLHMSVCFYVFGVLTLIATFYFKLCFPETKGKTLEEIQMDLKGIVFRRRSKISITIKS